MSNLMMTKRMINKNKSFVLLTIFSIFELTLSSGYDIVCGTGHYVTSEVKENFTVKEKDGLFGCMDGLSSEESMTYPGSPEELTYTVSTVGAHFTLLWKPPDDSSIQHVTGFLVEMFVEDYGNTMDTDPSKCYLIEGHLAFPPTEGAVPQDAVFQLNCTMTKELNVRISVTSLPAPAVGRSYKETSITVIFQGTATKSTPTVVSSRTSLIQKDSRNVVISDDNTASPLTIALVVIGISLTAMVTVIIYLVVYRHRNHTYRVTRSKKDKGRDLKDSSIPEDHFDGPDVKNITPYNKGTTNWRNQNIGITSIVNPLHNHVTEVSDKLSQKYGVTTNSSLRYSSVPIGHGADMNENGDGNTIDGSFPESYRLKLQEINSDI